MSCKISLKIEIYSSQKKNWSIYLLKFCIGYAEAAVKICFIEQLFWKKFAKFKKKFQVKSRAIDLSKKYPSRLLSCQFYETFQNSFLEIHLPLTVLVAILLTLTLSTITCLKSLIETLGAVLVSFTYFTPFLVFLLLTLSK